MGGGPRGQGARGRQSGRQTMLLAIRLVRFPQRALVLPERLRRQRERPFQRAALPSEPEDRLEARGLSLSPPALAPPTFRLAPLFVQSNRERRPDPGRQRVVKV